MAEEIVKSGLKSMKNVHFLIGLAIMLVFNFIPAVDPITPIGMKILGIFIATLYLWIAVDTFWASVLCIVAIGFSGYDTMGNILTASFGSSTVVQCLFMLIYVGALQYEKVSDYIGRFFLTRKISQGRPWVFLFTLCIGCFLYSVFMGPFLPIFLFWPVCYGIFKDVGYTSKDKFPKIMLIMIVLACAAGFPVAPYKGNALALLANYRNMVSDPSYVNDGMFFVIAFVLGILFLIISMLIAKYVFRPDTSNIKNYGMDQLNANPLPPMNTRQKVLGISFAIFALAMLVPSFFPTAPIMDFLYKNSIGLAVAFVAVLAATHIDGQPVIALKPVMAKHVDWGMVFLIAAAIEIGSVLTNKQTGITSFLSQTLSPVFTGMSYIMFVIILLLVLMVLTNICNSLVIGMISQPIIMVYAQTTGIDAAPIVTLAIFFVLSCAMFTPAASPFAAMMFSNEEWLPAKDICKYTGVFILAELVLVLVIGLPLTSLLL
jgi:solute carrier family 13 (sodium-dependent dicarboxylate transporter), member 2/3/5